jgi:hypothetical protein
MVGNTGASVNPPSILARDSALIRGKQQVADANRSASHERSGAALQWGVL